MAASQRQTMDAVNNLTRTLEGLLPKMISPGPAPKSESPNPPATPPVDANGLAALSAEVAALKRDRAVISAVADYGFSGDLRTVFEEMTSGVAPEQVKSIAEKLAKLKPAAGTAPTTPSPTTPTAPTAPTVKPGSSNAGPASPGAAPIIPDRLRDIPPDVLRTMSMRDIKEKYEAQKRAAGQGNPWAMARDQLQKK
jgi:hypothetical protein